MSTFHSIRIVAGLGLAVVCAAQAALAQVRPYRAIDLGTPIGQSPQAGVGAENMSLDGDRVAGWSVWEPYVWDRGMGMRPLAMLPGHQLAGAMDVNRAGTAVGRSGTLLGGDLAVIWDLFGRVTSLHRAGWAWSVAIGINEPGQVLITAAAAAAGPSRAFLGPSAGPFVDLAPGAQLSVAHDLNDLGQVCMNVDGVPMRYSPGQGLQVVLPHFGQRLNDIGQMAGKDDVSGAIVRYTDGVGWQQVGGATTVGFREVGGIDSFGQVVATNYVRTGVSPPRYAHYGYLVSDELGELRLDDLVDASQQVRVGTVVGISDNGAIACEGSIGPDNRAMLLEPRFVSISGVGCANGRGLTPKTIVAGRPARGGRIAFLAANGVASGAGALIIATAPATLPLPGGCTLLVDPTQSFVVPLTLGPAGQGSLGAFISSGMPQIPLHVQFVSLDASAPNGLFALSNAVRVDLQ